MLIRVLISSFIVCCSMFTSGCASIVSGNTQTITVETPPVTNAQCSLFNGKERWFINSTPGSTVINRSYQELNIECQKLGYRSAAQTVHSTLKPMVLGNVLFGGLIGVGVDSIDGAAFMYPTNIQIPMTKIN
jgi:hypothetical protein